MSLDKTAARHLTEQQTAPGKCCRGLPASECAYVPDRECALKAAAAPADADRLALAERIENDVLLPMRLYGLTNCGRISPTMNGNSSSLPYAPGLARGYGD